jgi:DNA polymerase-3 subunit beta
MSASEFPPVPSTEGSVSYVISKSKFAEMLLKTHYAASVDDSRQALTGVLLNFKDSKLTCVATDGRRLAMMEYEVDFPKENNRDVILPKRAVAELRRILSGEGDVKIYISKGSQAIFSFDNIVMCCKLVDSVYPNFRQVIITKCDHRITVPREELMTVLRRAVLVTTEKSNSMRLTFADNVLSLTASSPDVGEVQETVTVKYSGPKITAIFNPVFMADPLKALTNDEVYIELNDAMSPGLIKADLPFLYVLMPLRV